MKSQILKFYIVTMTVFGLCFSGLTMASDQVDDAASSQAKDLLKKVDELYRSDSAFATMEMEVVTPNWQRTMSLQSWSKGMDDTFIRILSPKKDRGVATLKLEEEMWNYFPKINKVIKVPPSMMMGSWMGSDFTNDDLVKEVSLVEDYEVSLTETPTFYTLALIPKEGTETAWEYFKEYDSQAEEYNKGAKWNDIDIKISNWLISSEVIRGQLRVVPSQRIHPNKPTSPSRIILHAIII